MLTTDYVVAGGFNFYSAINRRLVEIRKRCPDLTDDKLKNALSYFGNRALLSFGINLGSKKKENIIKDTDKYIQSIVNMIDSASSSNFIPDNMIRYIDSGGFQISMGYIPSYEIPKFIDMYCKFLVDHKDKYERAFSLDVPANDKVFKNFDELYSLNKQSYEKICELPKDVREKLIYVFHFRTPKTYEIWRKLTFEDGLMERLGSNKWAVGGIVASLAGDNEVPLISYVLPLVPFLNFEMQRGNKSFDYHILGGSAYRDVLFYSLMRKHVKELYGVEVNFTYDSSGLFKQLAMGRFLDFIDESNGYVYKVNVMSDYLNQSVNEFVKESNLNHVINKCNTLSEKFNLPYLDFSKGLYDLEGKNQPFFKDVELYLMFLLLDFYYELKLICEKFVDDVYPLYYQNRMRFNKEVFDLLHRLNRGTISQKFRTKTSSILNSMDFMNDLNEKKVDIMINKYMSKDEFMCLIRKSPTF